MDPAATAKERKASIGLARDRLLVRADEALYAAKDSGRNSTRHAA